MVTFYTLLSTLLIPNVISQTLFDEDAEVSFSGTNFDSSTGWVYEETIESTEQWGRLYYRIDDGIPAGGNSYVHITFMAINNGQGYYENTDGSTSTTTQQMRVVDSVGSTALMQSSPMQSMQYLLNIDTPSDGELNRDTEYIYYYKSNWTCMEWYLNSDEQQIQLYEDGELTYEVDDDLTFTGSTGATITFSFTDSIDMKVGMYTYNGISVSGAFKGVKVATSRIGCGDSTTEETTDSSESGGGNGGSNASEDESAGGDSLVIGMIFRLIFFVFSLYLFCLW